MANVYVPRPATQACYIQTHQEPVPGQHYNTQSVSRCYTHNQPVDAMHVHRCAIGALQDGLQAALTAIEHTLMSFDMRLTSLEQDYPRLRKFEENLTKLTEPSDEKEPCK